MKLGILCTMINGFGRKGFYNSQEIGLGRAVCRMGHNVKILKCIPKGGAMETVDIEPGLSIRYLPIGGLGAHGYLRTAELDRTLDGLLVFADNQIFLPHIERFCRKNGIRFVPYIGTAHSLPGNTLKSRIMDAWFAAGTLRLYKQNPVIFKTAHAREELRALGVQDGVIAPVGLDTAVLRQDFRTCDRDALRRTYGFATDDVVLCNISRMEPEKRPFDLIDLFKRVHGQKKFKLLVVGEGPLLTEVKARIAAYGLEADVTLMPRVPYEEMWQIYRVADYFLNLNRTEIFGMAVMEAVYYETAVLASMAPGPSITLAGMEGHRICQSDEEIVQGLLADYPDRATLHASSEKMARQFSWNVCAKAFVEQVERG